MKNLTLSVAAILLLLFSSCRHDSEDTISPVLPYEILKEKAVQVEVPQGEPLSREAVDEEVLRLMQERNDFRWEWMDMKFIWSTLQHTDGVVAIGYKPARINDVESIIHEINVREGEWKAVKDALVKLVLTELNNNSETPVKLEDILVEDDETLPILILKLKDKEVLTRLFNLENVRYLEPMGYWPQVTQDRSSTGCGNSGESLNSADWTTIAPGSRLPWNFNNHNIAAAWEKAEGSGITVGVIDAGLSSGQSLLGSNFTNGYSSGRSVSTGYTWGSSVYSNCSHGTAMSGLAVGPRNEFNATTGVAYKSNLYFIRACEDVILNMSSEQIGVKNALTTMGKNKQLRIISMSIGTPFHSSAIQDGVVYAYNQGKLMFAAAGTSYDWTSWWGVIYPAAYSQCIAVTGVRENGSTCGSCHDGGQVEFTITMERDANNNRNSLSLRTGGYDISYIGGSSCATATTAGIAALVWSSNSKLSREDVYTCLRNTSQHYPGKSSSHGYGRLNADAAVDMALTLGGSTGGGGGGNGGGGKGNNGKGN